MCTFRRIGIAWFSLLFCVSLARAQSAPYNALQAAASGLSQSFCTETPRRDADPRLCAPPSAPDEDAPVVTSRPPAKIDLEVPSGTPLRIALDQRARIAHPGEVVHGKVVETVYAFDQAVIPAGSAVTGRVMQVARVSAKIRALAYANGNFSPFHQYEVAFDTLTLPDGRELPIHTAVSPATADVVHLVSDPAKEKHKNAAARAAENAKLEARNNVNEAENRVHEAMAQVKSPGRLHRLKQFALGQLPYRRQYLEPGTRFNASLEAPLNFGDTTRTSEQLAAIGSAPSPESTLHARLVAEVSSATAQRGTLVAAVLTEPLYSSTHQLILPANSRLIGEVIQAKPARKLHHHGELRVIFERIETPEGIAQAMQGSLEGVEVDRAARMKLDEEGGAHASDGKSRYLSTGLALVLAAAAARPDVEHGTTDAAGDPAIRTGSGVSGFGFAGGLIGLAAKSTPVSIAFSAYGASASIYSNFLSRGREVVLPKDTPLEIGFGNPHPASGQAKPK